MKGILKSSLIVIGIGIVVYIIFFGFLWKIIGAILGIGILLYLISSFGVLKVQRKGMKNKKW